MDGTVCGWRLQAATGMAGCSAGSRTGRGGATKSYSAGNTTGNGDGGGGSQDAWGQACQKQAYQGRQAHALPLHRATCVAVDAAAGVVWRGDCTGTVTACEAGSVPGVQLWGIDGVQ